FIFGKYVGLNGTNPQAPVGALALARLVELAGGRPFDVHFYAQWDGGVPALLEDEIGAVHDAGLRVNLALKYVPPAGRDGDLAGFASWVSQTVAAHPDVEVWQITKEANVLVSQDTADRSRDHIGA